jgi:hypothetical protein
MPRKNLRNVPDEIRAKITSFEVDDIVVACAKHLRAQDLARYNHLGITLENNRLVLPPQAVPPPTSGSYSDANVNGREVVRKDLPMVQKTYSWEVPNWGDWSNGSHTQLFTRDVYQRDLIPPKQVELSITLLDGDPAGENWMIKFAVEQVLNRRAADFEKELLYNLNLLQENVHAVDVFVSTATLADYAVTIRVDWELLPPGTVDEVLEKILRGKKPVSPAQQKEMRDRLAVLRELKPEAYIAGTNEFLRYFGAKFGDGFVVFENVKYGNAIYVMYEKWALLSKRSRIDLLKGHPDGFERIIHRDGWVERLTFLLEEYRKDTRGNPS